ncbi:MAG: succinate dehydrogenase [Gammaproteobacteria bacterium]|nr:succinate dehydrogenase [Gammaproteobacteria bacterium]
MHRHLFLAQRFSALLLAPLVLAHIALIIIAVRHGLTAEEILSRTRGSVVWAVFYGGFVIAAAIHAPIGIRTILNEWTPLNGNIINAFAIAFALVVLVLGLRAVIAVTVVTG